MDADLRTCDLDDLQAAVRHLEDLDVFVGQRSRMHPGPGWAVTLGVIRRELDVLRQALQARREHPRQYVRTDSSQVG